MSFICLLFCTYLFVFDYICFYLFVSICIAIVFYEDPYFYAALDLADLLAYVMQEFQISIDRFKVLS